VPPARSSLALIAALLLGIAIGAAAAMLFEQSRGWQRTLAHSTSPDKSRVAFVAERRCGGNVCQTLNIGTTEADAVQVRSVESLIPAEVIWTPDGKRVGFVTGGAELLLYDGQSRKEVGIVRLMTAEAAQSRLARGVTFSENGRAVTFDDCPRTQSGCRAGVVGVPQ
jgi:Tol biopolymer transport system component